VNIWLATARRCCSDFGVIVKVGMREAGKVKEATISIVSRDIPVQMG
jgi:hypothetical protein